MAVWISLYPMPAPTATPLLTPLMAPPIETMPDVSVALTSIDTVPLLPDVSETVEPVISAVVWS